VSRGLSVPLEESAARDDELAAGGDHDGVRGGAGLPMPSCSSRTDAAGASALSRKGRVRHTVRNSGAGLTKEHEFEKCEGWSSYPAIGGELTICGCVWMTL
jgi:hypothetical protein